MRDGYYLSSYLHIDELSLLQGWSHRHDQNMSLWQKKGEEIFLVHYWDLERNSGEKHHGNSFYSIDEARLAINSLLSSHHLTLDDMQEVWGTPGLDTCQDYHSLKEFPDIPYHCVAHLFSALLMDSQKFHQERIIGLAMDGGPDRVVDGHKVLQTEYAGCVSYKGHVEIFPVYSPGILWYHAHNMYKMREGTLMALGSASTSHLLNIEVSSLLQGSGDPFNHLKTYLEDLKEKLDVLEFKDEGVLFDKLDPCFSFEENKISMFVKVLQDLSTKMVEQTLDQIITHYQLDPQNCHLAMAGGYALNCPTNSYLMKKYRFKSFMAPPCVNDSGISMGIALYAFYKKIPNLKFSLKHAYYGDEDKSMGDLESPLYAPYIKSVEDMVPAVFVKDLINHPLVWFKGKAEIGPRALGNRSILGDPRSKEAKKILNTIKQREWWRPVAPIILAEDVAQWYEDACYPSPFMLHTFQVQKEKVGLIPAVTHLDNSARVQTLTAEENPELYNCIREFKKETGVPIVANTSLNDKGEPIINTIKEALNFALRKHFPVIYLNNKKITLHNHEKYFNNTPLWV
jgi:carbamoyltransferase